jgi:tetratricopeptide (TPR) repeat protein
MTDPVFNPMRSIKRFARVAAALACLLSLAALVRPSFVPLDTRVEAQGARPREDAREESYRANNLGVALLEQFKHREGAEEFRRALKLDPHNALAQINLAIALYNVPDADAARKEAEAAAALAPDSLQPHYILGLIAKQQGRVEDALASFRRVLRIDPRDVGTNVQIGQLLMQQRKYDGAAAAFRVALAEEPYNGTALYNLGTALLRAGQREEGQADVQRFQTLRTSGAATVIGQNYLEQGRYAEAVTSTGAEPELVDKRTPDVTFVDATAQVFGPKRSSASRDKRRGAQVWRWDEGAIVQQLVASLGGGVTLFDYDGDGYLDLFAYTEGGWRLYHNEKGKFVDVTANSGALAKAAGAQAVAGDFDNDGKPDIFVFGAGSCALYRNDGGGHFTDVTAAAKIPAYPYLSASAAFVDYDHDGDLDIFIAGLADPSKMKGARVTPYLGHDTQRGVEIKSVPDLARGLPGAPNMLLRNNGDGTFTDVTAQAKVAGGAHAVAVVPTDFDNRRDVDLLVVNYGAPPNLFRNMRDGTFRDVAAEAGIGAAGNYTAAAVGDFNKDGFPDFYFASSDSPGLLAASDGRYHFKTSTPPASLTGATAAQFFDYDNDGLLDLVVACPKGLRVIRNVGDGWADVSEKATRPLSGVPSDQLQPRALASGDLDGDGDTDIVFGVPGGGLRVLRNEGGNRNNSVRVRLAGKVSNRGGVEAKVDVRAGSLQQRLETFAASPAPAPSDLNFGIGRRAYADAVRVLWPSGVLQAETESPAPGNGTKTVPRVEPGVLKVTEVDRKPSSCPYLYTWNGERFEFITDFMGGGEMGDWEAPGVFDTPDPDEYVRIRGDQLKEKNGRYEIRVTNELEEALFVDRLQLVAVSHPQGVEVYPNEGLGNPTGPNFILYATRGAHPPRAAFDDEGRDVLPLISKLDRKFVDDFKLLPIRGYAAEHTLTLDLGKGEGGRMKDEVVKPKAEGVKVKDERAADGRGAMPPSAADPSSASSSVGSQTSVTPSAAGSSSNPRTLLLLTGWTDYAFSSDNVAASQQGLEMKMPALQVKDKDGKWQTVIENIGFPVGRPQTVTVDLTGKFLSASREVRIVTSMRIYWDQILVDDSGGDSPVRVERLEASEAVLRPRGFSAQVSADGREPYGYDYASVSDVSPWKYFPGRYTRFGDVRELLRATDDMFVVSKPGDEIALSFDASALKPLPAGWTRTFLLYADGFSKEMDINSASPHELAPLPFHGMKRYPYSPPEHYPDDEAHRAYVERYNTRVVSAPLPSLVAGQRSN